MLNFSNQIGVMKFNENFIIVVKVQTIVCSTFHTCCDDYLIMYVRILLKGANLDQNQPVPLRGLKLFGNIFYGIITSRPIFNA